MPDLTFGEQVKIVLGRKGMTIKELAEMIEQRTNKKMSRQNLTQRLGRDNFQEQDMRMIASILECPFKLSILGEDTPDEKEIADIAAKEGQAAAEKEVQEAWKEDTQEKEVQEEDAQEKETREEDAQEKEIHEEDTQGAKEEDSGREITVGEFLEIRKSSGESAQEQLMQELLAEMDSIEREGRERSISWERRRQRKEAQEAFKKPEKKGGWMSHFRFRKHEEPVEPEVQPDDEPAASAADEAIEAGTADSAAESAGQESKTSETANTFSERIKEYTMQDDELREQMYEDEEEDLEAGDVNPYTGREYASNSVRMHPKRIGYVQVYNRKDHRWTDMTEWAFLGYQERKKVLLGKDYEPPIYLD